jgi:hypothetical protein
MVDDIDEQDIVEALQKARALASRAEEAASKAPPEMAAALRRSSAAMVTNLERALDVLRESRRMKSQLARQV